MLEPQRNPKTASQLNRYKPTLDILEDRSMPGNALIGISGFSLPFALSAQKALSAQIARAGSPSAAAKFLSAKPAVRL